MPSITELSAIESQRASTAKAYLEFLRVPAMSAGLYLLARGAEDQQHPHFQDEIYYVLRGRSRMRIGINDFDISPGQVIFVGAREKHRFFDIQEELALLVIFAPAEE
jgi:mannose-6-phosphate isomerase-like protein (cupin superfamily)